MKKVGLLTFHRALNYGAVLQAYALQQAIINAGYECEIIDYITPNNKREAVNVKNQEVNCPQYDVKRYQGFCTFVEKYLYLGEWVYHSEKDFIDRFPKYDFYVVGSDQIWNPNFVHSGVSSKIFFLHLEQFENKIAYAPSIGIAKPERLTPFLNYIQDFDFIFMREKETAEYLSEKLKRLIDYTCDPVFLLDRAKWRKVCNKRYIGEPYVLLYLVRDDDFSFRISERIAKLLNMKLIVINYLKEYRGRKVFNCKQADPITFLNLVKNANLVCTSSFHGIAFSIIFDIPFLAFNQIENDYRIKNILRSFSLEKRLLEKNSLIPSFAEMLEKPGITDIQYQDNRTKSLKNLTGALKQMENRKNE